jgi:hypothetical protein
MQAASCYTPSNISSVGATNRVFVPISIPISIPKSRSKQDVSEEHLDEYTLKCNIFNPGKMSPPDNWKCRLQQRINNYNFNTGSNE